MNPGAKGFDMGEKELQGKASLKVEALITVRFKIKERTQVKHE